MADKLADLAPLQSTHLEAQTECEGMQWQKGQGLLLQGRLFSGGQGQLERREAAFCTGRKDVPTGPVSAGSKAI